MYLGVGIIYMLNAFFHFIYQTNIWRLAGQIRLDLSNFTFNLPLHLIR